VEEVVGWVYECKVRKVYRDLKAFLRVYQGILGLIKIRSGWNFCNREGVLFGFIWMRRY